jgi:hypothetical protein
VGAIAPDPDLGLEEEGGGRGKGAKMETEVAMEAVT